MGRARFGVGECEERRIAGVCDGGGAGYEEGRRRRLVSFEDLGNQVKSEAV